MATITNLTESSTFKSWYETTNLLITEHNANTLTNNTAPLGKFKIGYDADVANTYLFVCNTFYADSTKLTINVAETTFNANVTIGQKAKVFTLAAQSVTISTNTRFDGNTTVNAVLTLLAGVSANANVTVNATFTVTGNSEITNFNANGVASVRQLVFGQAAAVCANSPSTGSPFNDFTPTGIANAAVLNLTPTGGGVLITGIAAPTYVGAAGAQVLYIQNLSDTYSVNLYSANTSSAAANRIKTPNDTTLEILPGGSVSLIYSKANQQWRPLSAAAATGTVSYTDLTLTGNLQVNGSGTINANAAFGTTLYVDKVNLRVGIGTSSPSYQLHTTGASYFAGLLTAVTANVTTRLDVRGNTSLGANAVFVDIVGNTVTLANTLTVSSDSQSYIRNLQSNTFQGVVSVTSPYVIATVNGAFANSTHAANATFSANLYIGASQIIIFSGGNTINATVFTGTANNATNAFGKAEAALNVNSAVNLTGATSLWTGVLKYSGASARLVIPVGTNLYAT
jgi:hypothetical protein